MRVPYSKKWLPIADQLQKLADAGLEIEDRAEAEDFLRHLNYYRFSGYGLAFEAKRHHFYPGTTFGQIRQTYEFDRALRDLVYESMEVIELDVRTSVAYTFGETYQAFDHCTAEEAFTKDWTSRVEQLIGSDTPMCPNALAKMGLTERWKEHPIWSE